jgi:hypothetical protein
MVRLVWTGWWLGLLWAYGSPASAQDRPGSPRVELRENYPNPFYPSTTIPFFITGEVCAKGHRPKVSLKIYNVLAQLVAYAAITGPRGERLDDASLGCGEHLALWDGRQLNGRNDPAPGVYYYQLSVDGQRLTRKMIVTAPEARSDRPPR